MLDKLLTLEDVLEGVTPIVEADPDFVYPQQDERDERCKCVERDTTEDEDYYFYHDPRTAPGISTTTTPACMSKMVQAHNPLVLLVITF